MSRSYREPVTVDGYGSKRKRWEKRYANKRIRKTADVPTGKAYRKFTDSWDICDYKMRWSPKPFYYFCKGEMMVFRNGKLEGSKIKDRCPSG